MINATRYYDFAGVTCASRKAGSALIDLTWLFGDHQGTQQIAVNASTQTVDIRRQTPYGGSRGSNTAWVNGKEPSRASRSVSAVPHSPVAPGRLSVASLVVRSLDL